jgi:hypothetical protein
MPYMFNRALKLAPSNLLDSMAWAARITEKVNAASGPVFRLWSRVLGPDIGTISWSTVVNDIGELTALEEQLMADGGYLELVEEGTRFGDGNGAQDSLGRLIHADPDGFDTAQYASITTTRLAPGMTATGVALGVELAQRVKSITGRPTSFGASVTGPYGQVAFFVLSDTIDQVQAANEALAADADWVTFMDDRVSKAFVAGASERFIMRRLA